MNSDALIDEELALEHELALEESRTNLLRFTLHTKPDYRVNWHHRITAQYLDDIVSGRITRLMVLMQPRVGKSELVSRRLPAYYLGRWPDHEVLSASYGATLAKKMNKDVQKIVESKAYGEVFPGTRIARSDVGKISDESDMGWARNSTEWEVIGRKGSYRCGGVGGSQTGYGANLGLIDDVIKNREEANSITYRDRVWDWYTSTFYTRLEEGGRIVLCMTRWHEDDLAGRLLKQAADDPKADQWVVVRFPSLCEDGIKPLWDPREENEPLWPAKYDADRLMGIRHTIGEREFASLYQQRPAPAAGNIVKREWFKFYQEAPAEFDLQILSVDLAFKGAERSDYCVMQHWGRQGAKFYLLGQIRAKMAYVAQKATLRQEVLSRSFLNEAVIEDAANAAALIDDLKASVPGLVPVSVHGKSKENRLMAVTPLMEAGNVYFPDPAIHPWVRELCEELAVFPNGNNDDQVDALSQALARMRTTMTWDFLPEGLSKQSQWLR